MLQVSWVKCNNGQNWCPLANVNLSGINAVGVYVIWHSGNPGRVVRVGQGNIADRINNHRNSPEVTQYARNGSLHVTWASVATMYLDGVERYLADTWNPLVGDAFPDARPIAVNSPWG